MTENFEVVSFRGRKVWFLQQSYKEHNARGLVACNKVFSSGIVLGGKGLAFLWKSN